MKQAPLTLRRWTRAEYDRLVDLGMLHGEPVELIGGHLVLAGPHGRYHASTLGAAGDALRAALPPGPDSSLAFDRSEKGSLESSRCTASPS